LIKDFSGDESRLFGIGFVVYALDPALSLAFSVNAAAAAATVADVFGRVTGLEVDGLRGSGGGARSGSELSHLLENCQ
jgi:hypothetical protein